MTKVKNPEPINLSTFTDEELKRELEYREELEEQKYIEQMIEAAPYILPLLKHDRTTCDDTYPNNAGCCRKCDLLFLVENKYWAGKKLNLVLEEDVF
jgi:hypothetical protein